MRGPGQRCRTTVLMNRRDEGAGWRRHILAVQASISQPPIVELSWPTMFNNFRHFKPAVAD
jgi:hypothetical protein